MQYEALGLSMNSREHLDARERTNSFRLNGNVNIGDVYLQMEPSEVVPEAEHCSCLVKYDVGVLGTSQLLFTTNKQKATLLLVYINHLTNLERYQSLNNI